MKHAKLKLQFSFGHCGGYKNTREGEQGGDGEIEAGRNSIEICSVKYMVLGDGCRSPRAGR